MNNDILISRTKSFVQETLKDAEGGHDWFHILRVYNTSMRLAEEEQVDLLVVALAALLHDIADAKFHDGDESVGPRTASTFMKGQGVSDSVREHVVAIIQNMSFKNSLDSEGPIFTSKEFEVVRDADRLDAIGAVGIARAFNYGGFRNRALYDPNVAPNLEMDKETYKKSKAPTINHFHEKLLLLKDRMHTPAARRLAEERHQFMLRFLEQFHAEWEGEA